MDAVYNRGKKLSKSFCLEWKCLSKELEVQAEGKMVTDIWRMVVGIINMWPLASRKA